jgi:hypothetical protein
LDTPNIAFSSRVIIMISWERENAAVGVQILPQRFDEIFFLFFSCSRVINVSKVDCKVGLELICKTHENSSLLKSSSPVTKKKYSGIIWDLIFAKF